MRADGAGSLPCKAVLVLGIARVAEPVRSPRLLHRVIPACTKIPGRPFSGEYGGKNGLFPQENPPAAPVGQRWWHRSEVTGLCLRKRLQRGNRNMTRWRCGSHQPRGEASLDSVSRWFAMFHVKKWLKKTPSFQQNLFPQRESPAATFPSCGHQCGR